MPSTTAGLRQVRRGGIALGSPSRGHLRTTASSSGTPEGFDWKRLDEIDVGDMVATEYGADLWSTLPARLRSLRPFARYGSQKSVRIPSEMTEELAFLLGAVRIGGAHDPSELDDPITNSVPEVRERVVAAWKSEFDLDAKIVDDGVRCPDVLVSSKTIVEFLEHLGCGARASEKRIPAAVLTSPRQWCSRSCRAWRSTPT